MNLTPPILRRHVSCDCKNMNDTTPCNGRCKSCDRLDCNDPECKKKPWNDWEPTTKDSALAEAWNYTLQKGIEKALKRLEKK